MWMTLKSHNGAKKYSVATLDTGISQSVAIMIDLRSSDPGFNHWLLWGPAVSADSSHH